MNLAIKSFVYFTFDFYLNFILVMSNKLRNEKVFFAFWAILAMAVMLFDFSVRTFFRSSVRDFPLSWSILIHISSFLLWVIVFFIQTLSIQYNNSRFHKNLGKYASLFIAISIISYILIYCDTYIENGHLTLNNQSFGRLFQIFLLPLPAIFGLIKIKNIFIHKRYFLLFTMFMIPTFFDSIFVLLSIPRNVNGVSILALFNLFFVFSLMLFDFANYKGIYRPSLVGLIISITLFLTVNDRFLIFVQSFI